MRLTWFCDAVLLFMFCSSTALLPSCSGLVRDTVNIGDPPSPFGTHVLVSSAPQLRAGESATWTVDWYLGTDEQSIVWDFGGGAEPNTITVANPSGRSDSQTVTMLNPGTEPVAYMVRVTITTTRGDVIDTPGSYTVEPPQEGVSSVGN